MVFNVGFVSISQLFKYLHIKLKTKTKNNKKKNKKHKTKPMETFTYEKSRTITNRTVADTISISQENSERHSS
jgi:uncharacterized membrane protein YciS (DUF1049 family)